MRSIIIRCDGSSTLGMGHLIRCLALAHELRSAQISPIFAVRSSTEALAIITAAGFTAVSLPHDYGPESLISLAKQHSAHLFFLDQRDVFSSDAVHELRQAGYVVAVYDDLSERRLAADICFFPPIKQIDDLPWNGFTGTVFSGWEWIMLRREFAAVAGHTEYADPPRILIIMGGADPTNFTLDALNAMSSIKSANVTVVIGPMMANAARIMERSQSLGINLNVVSSPPMIASLMHDHDLALASFGVTAYELAACGVPMALWGLTEDHLVSASTFVDVGIATVAKRPGNLSPVEVNRLVEPWLNDSSLRTKAGKKCQELCDGLGAVRVAKKIVELVDCNR